MAPTADEPAFGASSPEKSFSSARPSGLSFSQNALSAQAPSGLKMRKLRSFLSSVNSKLK